MSLILYTQKALLNLDMLDRPLQQPTLHLVTLSTPLSFFDSATLLKIVALSPLLNLPSDVAVSTSSLLRILFDSKERYLATSVEG